MRSDIFWLAFSLVVVSFIGNYLYYQSQQLKEPVFVDHYYEAFPEEHSTTLSFYYITNKTNPSEVSYIEFKDEVVAYESADHIQGTWVNSEQQVSYEQEYTHYYLRSVTVEIPEREWPVINGDIWEVNKAEVHFTNRDPIEVDIGQLRLHQDNLEYGVLKTKASGGGSNRRIMKRKKVLEPITIEAISVPFSQIEEEVAMKVRAGQEQLPRWELSGDHDALPSWFRERLGEEGKEVEGDLFPLSLQEDRRLNISLQFNPKFKGYSQFFLRVEGTKQNGNRFNEFIPLIDHPYLGQKDINEIINKKGDHS